MQIRPYEIGVISSTLSLPSMERIKKMVAEQGHHIHISRSAFPEAIAEGKRMEAEGVEVIICRPGIISRLLRENLRIPVLAIPFGLADILKGLQRASALGKRIIITSFLNEIGGLEILGELLKVEIHQVVYKDVPSLKSAIQSCKQAGFDVAVGGGWTMRIAEECALEYVRLETNEDGITAAFENAKSVVQANREDKEWAQTYRCILDATADGIIAVDNDGRITAINKTARNYLGINSEDTKDQPITRFIHSKSLLQILNANVRVQNKLEKINEEMFVINHLPVEISNECIGGVSTFKDVTNVMGAENAVRRSFTRGLVAKYSLEDLIHESGVMRDIVMKAREFAKTDSTILVVGATGTGKEVLAQSIHNLSRRAGNPFVGVHCGALPEQLIESELFGYEEGAFTGSRRGGSPGRFEMAHKGTIFLDDIDTTPLNIQTRLLRILQEKEVVRLGGGRRIPIDVRIIAAASQDLNYSTETGRFREDLFFRLNVLRINIPPLKNRVDDIPVLLKHYIAKFSRENGIDPIALPYSYLERLMAYSWPGNVRQLRNFAERLVLNSKLRCSVDPMDELFEELIQHPQRQQRINPGPDAKPLRQDKLDRELMIIKQALEDANHSKTKAAKALGVTRTTLWRKLKKAGL